MINPLEKAKISAKKLYGSSHDDPVKASVIIVSWNCRAYLLKCLESIFRCTSMQCVEWIVVDNASKDGTTQEVAKKFPEVRLIANKENIGFARANNMGIKMARGEYLFLVNPDVEFYDDCIGKLCHFMDKNPDVGICAPKILNTDGTIQHSCRELPSLRNNFCFAIGLHKLFPGKKWSSNELMSWFDHNSRKEVEALSGCFLVVRRSAIKKVGLLDERFFMYSEDVDWCKRFRDRGWRIVFVPEAKAVHHGGKSAETISVESATAKTKAKIQYWRKHHGPAWGTFIKKIIFVRHVRVLIHAILLILCGKRQPAFLKLKISVASIKYMIWPEYKAAKFVDSQNLIKGNKSR